MNLKTSWRNQLLPLRVLRIWLGFTWIYAGWDKANDPGFLSEGSPTFIGSQLAAYAEISPISFLLNSISEYAVAIGLLIMISEFAIGFATLLWIAPTWAAFGGFTMSLTLWLASTWNVEPYFLASNSAYTVLWLSYFLFLFGARSKRAISLDRRGFIRISTVASLALVGLALGKVFPKSNSLDTANSQSGSKNIIEDMALPIGETFEFLSKNGAPAVLFKTKNGVFAYSAICTHAGCTVQYNSASKKLQCGCHGAVFDPEKGGEVLAGPTNRALAKIKVSVSGTWIVES